MTLNKVLLIGRLGKDPELTYTQSGTACTKFSLATFESYQDSKGNRQEKTEWHNIIVWGKQAEVASNHLAKGRQVYIEGKIETRSWDDKNSGQKRYMTQVVSKQIKFLGRREDNNGGQGQG